MGASGGSIAFGESGAVGFATPATMARPQVRSCRVPAPVVVVDATTAAALVARGINVVLVADPAGPGLVPAPDGPGRLAVLVGSPQDPAVRAAAEAMAAELFRAELSDG